MTRTTGVSLAVLFVGLTLSANPKGNECRRVSVANIKSIFSIAPSPTGDDVLFYGSPEASEGEIITGSLFRLRLDKAEDDALRLKTPDASNPSQPVW